MPELPDVTVYVEAIARRTIGQAVIGIRIRSSFLLRTFEPPIEAVVGCRVTDVRRLGKRILIRLDDHYWLILHLMIAGRLHWKPPGHKLTGKAALAALDFDSGSLTLTEAGSKHRASLHLFQGTNAWKAHDPGGLEVMEADIDAFDEALRRENRTLKRALTDPRTFSGIGNAYSDEVLHRAGLSPLLLTGKISAEQVARLLEAIQVTIAEWTERLRLEAGDDFPAGVTAFRPEMAVHGRFGLPCPVCKAPVQRIRYADRETNYCAGCQTGGRILADRSLSRLLKDGWPARLDDL